MTDGDWEQPEHHASNVLHQKARSLTRIKLESSEDDEKKTSVVFEV